MAQVECCKQHELEKNNLYLSAIILDVILHYLFKCGPTEKKKSQHALEIQGTQSQIG